MYIRIYFVTVTVFTHPGNTTVCEGGTAVFTCVMNIENVMISENDISWWTMRRDHNNNALEPAMINVAGVLKLNISNDIKQRKVTSIFTITDVRQNYVGPYWLILMVSNEQTRSNTAFLNIAPNGTYICIYCMYANKNTLGIKNCETRWKPHCKWVYM